MFFLQVALRVPFIIFNPGSLKMLVLLCFHFYKDHAAETFVENEKDFIKCSKNQENAIKRGKKKS